MNGGQDFSGLALVLAGAFLGVFVVVTAGVRYVSREWQARLERESGDGPLSRLGDRAREFSGTKTASRLLGVFFALAGAEFMRWSYHDAREGRWFLFRMAAAGPLFVALGLWAAVAAPDLRDRRPTTASAVAAALGVLAGLAYVEFLRTGRWPWPVG